MKKLFSIVFATAIAISTASGAFDINQNLKVEPTLLLSYDLEDEVPTSIFSLDMTYQFMNGTDFFVNGSYDLQTKRSTGIQAGVESVLSPNLTARGYLTIDERGQNDNLYVELEIHF